MHLGAPAIRSFPATKWIALETAKAFAARIFFGSPWQNNSTSYPGPTPDANTFS